MGLTSEQAKDLATRSRIPPEVADQAIVLYADGQTPAGVHERFPDWAEGTWRNFRSRKAEQINELRRKRTVQFEDLFIVRKQARLDDYQDLRNIAMAQIRSLLAGCFVIDGQTGHRSLRRIWWIIAS